MKVFHKSVLALAVLALSASAAAAGELKLTLNNGLVTVVAQDVPISQILSEWARIGQTKIVNGEKLMTVVSLELVDVPEKAALDIVLRSASGYLAARRTDPVPGASAFDRIMILPFSQPPAVSAPMPTAQTMPQPFVNRPVMATPDFDDSTLPPGVREQLQGQLQGNLPQTMQTPGMLPQPTAPNGQPQQQTAPRPGFLPPPAVKPPGGGQ
jgi:hypothetical protein